MTSPKDISTEVPFDGGVDQGTSERAVSSPRLLTAENVEYAKEGRLAKRRGYENIFNPGGVNLGLTHLHSARDILQLHGHQGRYFFDEADGGWTIDADFSEPAPASRALPVMAEQEATSDPDVCIVDGDEYHIFSSSATKSIYRRSVDGGFKSRTSLFTDGGVSYLRAVTISSSTSAIVWISANNIRAIALTASGPGPIVTFATNVHATDKFLDVVRMSDTEMAVTYRNNGATSVSLLKINVPAFTVASTLGQGFSGNLRSIGVYWSEAESNGVWMIADDTLGLRARHFDSVLAGTAISTVDASATDVLNTSACDGTTSGRIAVIYDENAVDPADHSVSMQEVTADETTGAPVGSTVTQHNAGLAAKPFNHNGTVFAPLAVDYTVNAESMCILSAISLGLWRPCGRAMYLTHGGIPGRNMLPGSTEESSGRFISSQRARVKIVSDPTVHTSGSESIWKMEWDFRPQSVFKTVNYGRTPVQVCSSMRPTQGMPHAPHVSLAASTGGSLTMNSDYTIQVVIQHVDTSGQVHWSVPSVAQTVSISGGQNRIVVTLKNPLFVKEMTALVFRSQADDASLLQLSTTQTVNTLAASVTINVDESDASIQDNEIIYTNGDAQLAKHAPPASRFGVVHDDRLWVISDDDGSLWHSNRIVQPESVSFSPILSIPTDIDTTRPVALGTLTESRLAVLWEDKVAIVYGSGPDVAGRNSSYSVPLPVAASRGTNEPRSVISTHLGVCYGTTDGFYLLSQSGQAQRISRAVDSLDKNTCVGVAHLRLSDEIAFVVLDGSDTVVLYWEYVNNRWTTQRIVGFTAVDAVEHAGQLYILMSTNVTWRQWTEAEDRYDHGGTNAPAFGAHAPMDIRFPWLKSDGKQGRYVLQDAMILGEKLGDGGMQVQFTTDYGTTVRTATYSDAELDFPDTMQVQVLPAEDDVEVASVRILQTQAVDNSSKAFALDSVRLTFVPIRTGYKGIHDNLRKGAS